MVHEVHIKTYNHARLDKSTMRCQRYEAQDKFKYNSTVLVGSLLSTL